jgi:ketosteroid isomerase-like protein
MRVSYALVLIGTLATPATAVAADENLKAVVEKLAAAYADNTAKQNPAGIAALYANGGMLVIDTGTITDITKYYDGAFKAGINHNDITIDQVQPLGTDALIATGEYHLTGENESGAPIDLVGFWTATDVKEGGAWKIRMLTAFPKAPAPAPKN